MANPFDAFDKPTAVAARSGGNPFDAFDQPRGGKPAAPAPAAEPQQGGPQLEYPDAPTTGRLELPGVAVWNGKDVAGNEGLSIGGKAATLYGTLMTDNPKARQQIYAKHLPGAKAVDDKFGNPMIEYKGQKYYTARPGEFDAMDAGRVAAGVAASVPLMAMGGPAGLPAMMAVGGATNAAMSLGEDALTRAAGGEAQSIDGGKATMSAVIGAALPPVLQKVITPAARATFGAVAPALVSESGNVTRHGQQVFAKAGINTADLTADQLRLLDAAYRKNFGNTQAIQQAERKLLGDEFGVGQTTAQITRNPAQLAAEDQMRHGGRGERALNVMNDATVTQRQALDDAGNAVRAQITGSDVPLTPQQIGERIQRGFGEANEAAKGRVRDAYTRAFDPAELQARGIPTSVDIDAVYGLPNAIKTAFDNPNAPGGMLIPTRSSTPNAYAAIQRLRKFSENGDIPSAFPEWTMPSKMKGPDGTRANVTELGWQGVDMVRKQLVGLYRGAQNNPTDSAAMRRVIAAFDEHFGAQNTLLNAARAEHQTRMETFFPQRTNAAGTNAPLRTIANENNPGQTIYNALFESGALKRGETGPLMQQLQDMFASRPEVMQAVKEGALQRILVNRKTGDMLSPQKAATAFKEALEGPQGEIYRTLFTAEEKALMSRYGRLSQNIAETTARQNASGSSYPINRVLNRWGPQAMAGAIGAAVGSGLGPIGTAVGGAAGGYVGARVGDIMAGRAAQRAVSGAGAGRLAAAPGALPGAYQIPAPTVLSLLASEQPNARRGLLDR